jgi:putative hemolysin
LTRSDQLARRAPFGLEEWVASPAFRPLGPLFERALGLSTLNRLYGRLPQDERSFCDKALNALGVGYDATAQEVAQIPRSGPLVVVANHPFGCLDGLVLMSLLRRVRPDVKLMGNYLLARIPEMVDMLIPVDPFGHPKRRSANAAAMLSAIRWVRSGGALVVFPSGEVSHARSDGVSVDPPWSHGIGRLVLGADADVVPIFFPGRNSPWFEFAGRLHPRLRTALLPRELLRQRGSVVNLRIGSPIPSSRVRSFDEPQRLVSYLRVRTYGLAASDRHTNVTAPTDAATTADEQPIDAVEREILALDASCHLLRSGTFDVYIARAEQIPRAVMEIGRLREIAFRRAGEGTGEPRDLDRFDGYYMHLFAWQRERREIAGGYRIAATDQVLPRLGISGLYTSTLFCYDDRLLSQIGPALELGRAFVRVEYQRDYGPLMLLWKGIGTFVSRNPRYRRLFGPVSISNSYNSLSRQILAQFLYATSYRQDLGELVAPKNPPSFLKGRGALLPVAGSIVKSLADVAALVAEIEADQKGVPVLLRQYLKLNARLLGFNLDPSFGDVLDGLMLVDLADVDRGILARYMGADRAATFLRYHGVAARRQAS